MYCIAARVPPHAHTPRIFIDSGVSHSASAPKDADDALVSLPSSERGWAEYVPPKQDRSIQQRTHRHGIYTRLTTTMTLIIRVFFFALGTLR